MIMQLKCEDYGNRWDGCHPRVAGFRSHREFLIYLGWLRLYRKIHPATEKKLQLAGSNYD